MAQQIWVPYRSFAHPFRVDLYILGMVAHAWSMKGKDIIVHVFQKYWMLFLFGLWLASTPHVIGRCDLDPMDTWWERMRFRGIEAVLIVLFLSGAMHCDDPYGMMGWLNMWSLWAFCTHVAAERLLPVPLGVCVTFASMVPFLMLALRDRQSQRQAERDNCERLCHDEQEVRKP